MRRATALAVPIRR